MVGGKFLVALVEVSHHNGISGTVLQRRTLKILKWPVNRFRNSYSKAEIKSRNCHSCKKIFEMLWEIQHFLFNASYFIF